MQYVDHFYMDYLGQSRYVGILQYVHEGITFYFIDNESYFNGPKPYGDWYWDLEKFCFFCRAALSALPVIGFQPDIVHCHDWQTGLIPVLLATASMAGFYRNMKSVITIHNPEIPGRMGCKDHSEIYRTADYYFTPDKLEAYKDGNLLKGGIVYADAITTVSNTLRRRSRCHFMRRRSDGLMQGQQTAWVS